MWDGRGDLKKTFGPRDLFDWIYAVLHSPTYRTRYAEFLKSDFPRIPRPASRDLFAALIPLGRELVALHLLKPDEAPILKTPEDPLCRNRRPPRRQRLSGIRQRQGHDQCPTLVRGRVARNLGLKVGGYQCCING